MLTSWPHPCALSSARLTAAESSHILHAGPLPSPPSSDSQLERLALNIVISIRPEWQQWLGLTDREAVKTQDKIKTCPVVRSSGYISLTWTFKTGTPTREQRHQSILDSDNSQTSLCNHTMASSHMLTRLVLLLTLFLGVFAVEHAPLDAKTPKRQTNATQEPQFDVRDFNLWVTYSSNNEYQLTTTGTRDNPFAIGNVFVSPNNTFVVAWQYTPPADHNITLIDSVPDDRLEPRSKEIRYPKAGDRVRVDRPRMFNLATRAEIPTDGSLFQNPYTLNHMGWSANGQEYRFFFDERGHQRLRIIGMHINGTVRALVDDSSETFIDVNHKLCMRPLDQTEELLWFSERDGWNHLYLYDLVSGTLKNQITRGNWLVKSVERVDLATRRIWFSAFGIIPSHDPYYAHLAVINFDGTGLTVLTSGNGEPGNGNHVWAFTANNTRFIDIWSRVDQQESSLLRNAETGQVISVLGTPKPNPLSSIVEIFVAPGRDGNTSIHGIIVKPSNFDPSKKYPILEDIYAGPTEFSTPKSYSPLSGFREWADRGYIVVKMDGMGTNWRSKAFHNMCWKNLKDAGFPDRIAWIKAAAATRPWMDLSRVGVLGGSAGGQNAVAALLFHPDFYKVAAADSGCHDNRMGPMWWSEAWMGWPVGQQYEDSSNVVHAGKLQGKLFLTVGALDANVDPSTTFQLVHALNEADKDYELVYLPKAEHGAGFVGYAGRRMADFFRRNLLEA